MSLTTDAIVTTGGDMFCIAAANGDIRPHTLDGLYACDTRFLSGFELTINDQPTEVLRAGSTAPGRSSFCLLAPGGGAETGGVTVIRNRSIDDGLHEEITLFNHAPQPLSVRIALRFGADFADIFEVRRFNTHRQRQLELRPGADGSFTLCYRREHYRRETRIACSPAPQLEDRTARYTVAIEPHSKWSLAVDVVPAVSEHHTAGRSGGRATAMGRDGHGKPADPLATTPRLETGDLALRQAWERAIADLRDLTIEPMPGRYLLAAGIPWFMTVFGRDSIIAALEVKLLSPRFLVDTLAVLSHYQADTHDRFREAEPGKIPHEIRSGELSEFEDVPHSRYYGSVDATPLFIILLHEAYQWTGDPELVRHYLPAAERALDWIEHYGDLDGDGFTEYPGHAGRTLANQGWKDSGDAIAFADGRPARGPIALAEVQGYVYRALLDMAAMHRLLDRNERAVALKQRAARLKARFNAAFWMPEREYYAIALDGDKRRIDAISSNIGHCLWTGIVADDRAPAVARRLADTELFTGWGVRTLSEKMARYHPLSYHNGSVWPHDTVIAAAGLARYGYHDSACRIIDGLIEAAAASPDQRLPELFAGYDRTLAPFPIPYPSANAPQAWAAGAVIYAVEILFRLQPQEATLIAASKPVRRQARLYGVPYRGRRWDF